MINMCASGVDCRLVVWLAVGVCLALPVAGLEPTCAQAGSERFVINADLQGSTIVSTATEFQPDLIYKKYPTIEPVVPGVVWELSFGALLETAPPSVGVTLSLDPAGQNADIQIVIDSANFVLDGALHHNYDPAQRFEILYTGASNPFTGPVDFLLEPDGLPSIPVRVDLNVIAQPGFPLSFLPTSSAAAPVGDIAGDPTLEIIVPGDLAGVRGLHAFDHTGTPLAGWPFRLDEPDVVDQSYSTPAIVDLDGDGKDEVVVVGFIQRNVPGRGVRSVIENTTSLFGIEGSGDLKWEATDDILPFSTASVADLTGNASLDIIVGGAANLRRYDNNGSLVAGWQVQTIGDIIVRVPVLADVDGIPGNGLEIIACTPESGVPNSAFVYVWNDDGSLHDPAWPIALDACVAPAVANLDGDPTNGNEIVMAISHAEPAADPGTGFLNTFSVFAWHADGTDVSGWPHHFLRDPSALPDDRILSSPSIADLDGDGNLEVIVGTYGQGNPASGNLFVFHHDGSLDPDWPQWAGTAQTPSFWGGTALGDLDNDGGMEIVTGSFLGVYVFRRDGSMFEGFPRFTSDNFAQPMIADLDGDGRSEIIEASVLDYLSVWKVLTPSPDAAPWPRFRQNPARTGARDRVLAVPIPAASTAGAAAIAIFLLGAGVHIIRRRARISAA